MRIDRRLLAFALASGLLASCGGSSRSSPPATYAVGGNVQGLSGAGLVLQNNGGDDLSIAQDGAFAFAHRVEHGRPYAVTVKTAPAGQSCTVAHGAGTVAGDVLDVVVTCSAGTQAWAIGGGVSGLGEVTGLVLHNSDGQRVDVPAGATTWAFGTPVANGDYVVSVEAQPTGLSCAVAAGGAVTVSGADVTDVNVSCVPVTYRVAGTLTGMPLSGGTIVLRNNGGDDLTLTADGAFQFAAGLADGAAYSVTVATPPGNRVCNVTHGQGVIAGADVADVSVTCTALTYDVGGAIAGLQGAGLRIGLTPGTAVKDVPSGAVSYAFTGIENGTYQLAILASPSGTTCRLGGGATMSVTVAGAPVANANVTCTANPPSTFTVGGAIAGLDAAGLQIGSNIPGASTVSPAANATSYVFATPAPNGTYTLTISASPSGALCRFGNGTTSTSVTVAGAPVTTANVTCESVVVQRWTAPTTWGGTTWFWDDGDATLVQHAHVDASGNVLESKSRAFSYTGGALPAPTALDVFPGGTRYGTGPFPTEGVNFQAHAADAALDIPGDMLVCAVVQPDFDPVDNGHERPIVSKGVGNATADIAGGGWSLMQMHQSYCFHYELQDANGTTHTSMAFTPTLAANQDALGYGTTPPSTPDRDVAPLPSWVVVCGGRDGDALRIAVNGDDTTYTQSLAAFGPAPHVLDPATLLPTTIGGYTAPLADFPGSEHVFRGRVYETAVWRVAATPANIRARMAAVEGLAAGATYTRNRPAPVVDSGGELRMSWHHAPRIDPAKGMLFGMQSWNRVNYWQAGVSSGTYAYDPLVFAASEDFSLWAQSGGAAVSAETGVKPPTGVGPDVSRISLPVNASLALPLNQALPNANGDPAAPALTWYVPGVVHGQIWLRMTSPQPAGSVLRVRKDYPDLRSIGVNQDHYDVNLASLRDGAWTRVWLNGDRGGADVGGALSTDGSHPGTVFLENRGTTAITFDAWGLDLTQIGGGGDLNSMSAVPVPFSAPSPDPGPLMYDWSAANDAIGSFDPYYLEDVLQPAPVPASTAGTGFCLSVDAQPYDTFAWDVRVHNSRTPIAWANAPDPAQVTRILRLYVQGLDAPNTGKICFASRALTTPGDWSSVQPEDVIACGDIPAGWAAGSRHNLRACSTAAGALSIYADYPSGGTTPIATGNLVNVPDLGTGRLLIGNGVNGRSSFSSPWHGYVSKALVCRATDLAACE